MRVVHIAGQELEEVKVKKVTLAERASRLSDRLNVNYRKQAIKVLKANKN